MVLFVGGNGVKDVSGLGDAVAAVEDAQDKIKNENQHGAGGAFVDQQPGQGGGDHRDVGDTEDKTIAVAVGQSAPEPQRDDGAQVGHGYGREDKTLAVAQVFEQRYLKRFGKHQGRRVSQHIGQQATQGPFPVESRQQRANRGFVLPGFYRGVFRHGDEGKYFNKKGYFTVFGAKMQEVFTQFHYLYEHLPFGFFARHYFWVALIFS